MGKPTFDNGIPSPCVLGAQIQPARSRTGVAKRLDISVKRVARLETTGLRRLRTLHGRGACSVGTSTTVTSAAVTASTDTFATKPAPGNPRSGKGSGASSGGGESDPPAAGGVDPPATGDNSGVRGATQSNQAVASQTGGVDLMVPLILLMVAGFTFLIGRAVKREPAAPVAGPAPEPDRPPSRNPSWTDPRPGIDD